METCKIPLRLELVLRAGAEADDGKDSLRRQVRTAHHHAESLSQTTDHPVLHLLDATLVMLGAEGFHREKALTQAAEDCRRALGEHPPAWNEMRALLHEALEHLEGESPGAQGLAKRIRDFLERLHRPAGVPAVRVDITGGAGFLVEKPYGVAVEIRDYDTEGADPAEWNLIRDSGRGAGAFYSRDYYGPEEEAPG